MGKIQKILDKNSVEVYPVTHERAVKDSNGVTLETKLTELENKVDEKLDAVEVTTGDWIWVITDSEGRILEGIKADGSIEWSLGIPTPVQTALDDKVDEEEGKSLIDSGFASSQTVVGNSEYLQVVTDSEDKVLEGTKRDGTKYIAGDLLVGGNVILQEQPTNKVQFCSDTAIDAYIEELYLPNFDIFTAPYIKKFVVSKNGDCNLFLYDGDNQAIAIEGFAVNKRYYEYGSITPLYRYDSSTTQKYVPELLGWIKLRYIGVDITRENVNVPLDVSAVCNIENSQSIKSMVENPNQILIWGDSKFGFIHKTNTFTDMLQGVTGMRVYNCDFGGCQMSWRTQDGSSDYDKFTAVSLSDAWVNNNFAVQNTAYENVKGSSNYYKQMEALKSIDLSKNTFVLLNYMGNDFTGNAGIGTPFEKEIVLSSYDKTTLLGAMNYAVQNMLNTFDNLFLCVCPGWYAISNVNGEYIPMWNRQNSLDKSFSEYFDALENNAKLLGLRYIDFTNEGTQNYFQNKRSIAVLSPSEQHLNSFGYARAVKWLSREIEMVFN